MPLYTVLLAQSFVVEVEAENPEMAEMAVESFVGYTDRSTLSDRTKYRFEIQEIDMTVNDVLEVYPTAKDAYNRIRV